ncbi:RNA polymerase sigma factor [Aquimarina algiphila]|uniref:RNA polymerase sigma factor n=1 Tax=Aquimarina algiphila TaxID=2047982 RepID=UPI00232F3890|nr:RNA polymerase sigma factor [Aquimarina algiphila]
MKDRIEDNDIHLIKKIKEGDTTAFRHLVEKYKDVSLTLAISILKDQSIAEDVLQDVFIKVYQKIGTFKFKSNFSTWLYRIVVNTSYNAFKKQRSHISIDKINSHEIEANQKTGVEKLNEKDQKKYITLALERLTPDEALLIRLFYLCDLKITEIKDVTGFSVSKIKVGLHRGRNNMNFILRKILEKDIDSLL